MIEDAIEKGHDPDRERPPVTATDILYEGAITLKVNEEVRQDGDLTVRAI